MNKRKPLNLFAIVALMALLLPSFTWAAYPAEVARTGQITCYDVDGYRIDCVGTGQDGAIQAGAIWPEPRFIDNGDGTVSDSLTGLEWMQDANAGGAMTWQQALDYVKTLNTAGHSDWRLPNMNELESLNNAELYDPALQLNYPFTNLQSYYLSSTTHGFTDLVWEENMSDGRVKTNSKYPQGHFFVWPVRAGQVGNPLISTTTTTIVTTTTSSISSATTTVLPTTSTTIPNSTTTTVVPSTTTTTTTMICPAQNVLGADNPKLKNLRIFRDSKLANSAIGCKVIQIYYNNAASINAALDRSPALRALAKRTLEVITPVVGRKE